MIPKNKFTIISCYTKNNKFSKYETEANLLKESMTQFGLDTSHIEEYQDTGLWSWNSHYKIKFIKQKLKELKSPVVWTDADSRIKKYPELFNNLQDYDFAANFTKKQGNQLPGINERELINSGTMFFNNNDKVINMLDVWIDENNKLAANFTKSQEHQLPINSKEFCDQEGIRSLLANLARWEYYLHKADKYAGDVLGTSWRTNPAFATEYTGYVLWKELINKLKLKTYKLPHAYYRISDDIYKSEFYNKYKHIETIIEHTQASVRLKRKKQVEKWKNLQ